jgi:hypothetical protein
MPRSHREIIDLWPSLTIYAADLGIDYGLAKAQRHRNSIPDPYRPHVVAAARRRKIAGVTYKTITLTAAARKARQ